MRVKLTIRQLLFLTAIIAVAMTFIARPLALILDGGSIAHAACLPWQHWAWCLGFDVSYTGFDPSPGPEAVAFLISTIASLALHIVGGIFAFSWICETFTAMGKPIPGATMREVRNRIVKP